jgi:hypothetical protein
MKDFQQFLAQQQTRRAFLGRTAHGVGKLALASLMSPFLFAVASEPRKSDRWTGVVASGRPNALSG